LRQSPGANEHAGDNEWVKWGQEELFPVERGRPLVAAGTAALLGHFAGNW
jgi:hypothetical protein